MKKSVLITIIIFIGLAILVFYLYSKNIQENAKPKEFAIKNGRPDVQVSSQQAETGKTCTYTANYGGKQIKLEEDIRTGDCKISQGPLLSDGMLAIIAKDYVFIYDPKKNTTVKLDPYAITGFTEFAQENNIDLSNEFGTKRFFINGDTLQILYTGNPEEKAREFPKTLMFTSDDLGKTFMFDPNTQQ